MINNRQQTGRRRGRGGQRPGGGNGGGGGGNPGRPDNGNRIDNRARGNASQLYEKYKSLASEAQRQGDRVNTEYYLQFADHYFRVLSETRARFEDQQPRPQRARGDEYDGQRGGRDEYGDDNDMDGSDGDGDDYGDEGDVIRPGDQMPGDRVVGDRVGGDQPRQRPQQVRPQANDGRQYEDRRPRREEEDRRPRRDDRERQGNQPRGEFRVEGEGAPRAQAPVQVASEVRADTIEPSPPMAAPEAEAPQPRRRGRPRKEPVAETQGPEGGISESSGFDADRLPPALGIAANDGVANDGEVKPRRRRARTVEAPAAE
jgi:hypothetical protein